MKFHAFFRTVILKGEVLGKVDHFYWKKEYQARGVPHRVLLWIRDTPVIGRDDPDKVVAWIQERITCHIPHKASILSYTCWLLDTKCTSAARTASEGESVVLPSLIGGSLGFLAKTVKTPK